MVREILKLADSFYLAVLSQDNRGAKAIVQQMQGLTNGAIVAVNHMLTFPQYKRSPGLLTLKNMLPKILTTINSFKTVNDYFTNSLDNLLGSASFYTAKGNAGTGKDPITSVRVEGYSAPGYYIDTLIQLNDQLKRYNTENPDPRYINRSIA